MEADLRWPRPTLAAGFSLALLIAGLASLPVGRWIDRRGGRGLMTAGSVAATGLVLAWSVVETRAAYYATFAGLGVAMAMLLYEPAFAVIAVWFRARRRQALTALTLVAGLASTVFLPLTAWLVELCGWRGALRILALVLFAVTVPIHGLLLRRRPEDLGLFADGATGIAPTPASSTLDPGTVATAVRSLEFRGLAAAAILHAAVFAAFSVHLVTLLVERGASAQVAAAAAGIVGFMQLPGRAALPWIDRDASRRLLAPAILGQSVALALLAGGRGTAVVIAALALFGLTNGMLTVLRADAIARIFGAFAYGRISGTLALVSTFGRAAGPFAAAAGRDAAGGYAPVLVVLAVLLLGAAAGARVAERSD